MSYISPIFDTRFIEIGFIQKLRGFEGQLQVKLQREIDLDCPQFVEILIDGSHIPFKIEQIKPFHIDNTILLTLNEIKELKEAEEIVNCTVFMTEECIKKNKHSLSEDTEALIDFTIHDQDKNILGKTIRVEQDKFMATLYFLNNNNQEKSIPFNESYIQTIDQKNKVIQVLLPDNYKSIFLEDK